MASASTAPLTSIAQATSFEQLCDIEDLVYPSDDKAVKDLLAASAVQLPPDCNLSKNVASVKKARRERACCVVWLRYMLHTPDVYLQLPPSLVAYAQGIYHLRADHLNTDRWAVSLATTLALNMADHGDTPVKKSGGGGSGGSGPVSKKAARTLNVSPSQQQQQSTVQTTSPSPTFSSSLQLGSAQNPFAQLTSPSQPHSSPASPAGAAASGPWHAHTEKELLAIIPDELKWCLYFASDWTAKERLEYQKALTSRPDYEDPNKPMFAHRLGLVYSANQRADSMDFAKFGKILALMLCFDSPEMHRIVSMFDSGDEKAREDLDKRLQRIREAYEQILLHTRNQVTVTWPDVSKLLLALHQTLKAKRERLGILLQGRGSAADEILRSTDFQIQNVGAFFNCVVPKLQEFSSGIPDSSRASFVNYRVLSLVRPSVESLLGIHEQYDAAKDPHVQSGATAFAAFGLSPAVPALPPPAYVPPPPQLQAGVLPPPPPYGAPMQFPPPPHQAPPAAAAGRNGGGGAGGVRVGGGGGGGRGAGGAGAGGGGGFLGRPLSAALVGTSLAVLDPLAHLKHACQCRPQGPAAVGTHFCWECPQKYHARFGSCPGFNADGTRILASWSGDEITAATRQEWRTFIAAQGLASAISARGAEVNF